MPGPGFAWLPWQPIGRTSHGLRHSKFALARPGGRQPGQLAPRSANEIVEVRHDLLERGFIEGCQIAVRQSVASALTSTQAVICFARFQW